MMSLTPHYRFDAVADTVLACLWVTVVNKNERTGKQHCRWHRAGWTLAEVRTLVDVRFVGRFHHHHTISYRAYSNKAF